MLTSRPYSAYNSETGVSKNCIQLAVSLHNRALTALKIHNSDIVCCHAQRN